MNGIDKKTTVIFDIVGSFFVDTFYNGLYLKAVSSAKLNHVASVTDGYKNNIVMYIQGIKQKKLYVTVIKQLHEYYQAHVGRTVDFASFEDEILAKFIPSDYYNDFSNGQKDQVFNKIIVESIEHFGASILQSRMFQDIIDKHADPKNITALQDMILNNFVIQRSDFYDKFVSKITEKTTANVNRDIDIKYQKERKLRVDAEADRDKAISLLKAAIAKFNQVTAEKLENESKVGKMLAEYNNMSQLLAAATEKNKQLEAQLNFVNTKCRDLETRIYAVTPAVVTPVVQNTNQVDVSPVVTPAIQTTAQATAPPSYTPPVTAGTSHKSSDVEDLALLMAGDDDNGDDDSAEEAYKRQQEALQKRFAKQETSEIQKTPNNKKEVMWGLD